MNPPLAEYPKQQPEKPGSVPAAGGGASTGPHRGAVRCQPMAHALASDGVRVAYTALEGAGPSILFAHATGFHGYVWRPVAGHLGDSFSPYVFDHRGHGDTPAAPSGQSWLGFAEDALAVIDEAALARPFGAGHSSGGAALLLAELARPGTFEALWLFEPILPGAGATGAGTGGNSLAAGARRRREVFADRASALENFAGKPPFSSLAPEALRAYVDHGFDDLGDGTVRLKCRGEVEAATYEMAGGHGAAKRLGEIGCRVVFAAGGRTTTPFGAEHLAELARGMRDAGVETFPELGHFGPMEDPASVAASIRRHFG